MPELPPQEESELSARLQAWRVEAEIPVDFRRSVWARIANRPLTLRERFLRYWEEPVRRPGHALAAAALTLSLAFGAAHQHAAQVNASRLQAAERAYVQSISPTLQARAHASPVSYSRHDF